MSSVSDRIQLIEAIHQSDLRLSLALTGGGSGLISELLSQPGASKTVLEATVPYSQESLTRFLGKAPESFCSPETSRLMAIQAYCNSRPPDQGQKATIGRLTAIGCTAALVSNSPKKGDHRFFNSIQTENMTSLAQVVLEKGARSRAEEENLIVELGLQEIARLIGVEYHPIGLTERDSHQRREIKVNKEWSDVFHGRIPFCCANKLIPEPRGVGILSGAFNPLHNGHLEMAEIFARKYKVPVHFELAIKNADKPPIDYLTIRHRLNQFGEDPVWLTNSGTFVEKSRIFPGNLFIVGLDTIARIADPVFYSGRKGMLQAIQEIRENDCRFVVYGRFDGQRFVNLSDLNLDSELTKLCDAIPEKDFRKDVSSTMIRMQSLSDSSRNPSELFG